MRRAALILLASLVAAPPARAQTDPDMAKAVRVLHRTPLIDGHNDLPWAIRESEAAPKDVAAPENDLRGRSRFMTDRDDATVADVADHIEHIVRIAGIDHVGIGSDFDGITRTPVGLEDVSTFPRVFAELSRRGWGEDALAKLAGENVLRVMRRAEAVARRLRRERGPSMATIEELDHGASH